MGGNNGKQTLANFVCCQMNCDIIPGYDYIVDNGNMDIPFQRLTALKRSCVHGSFLIKVVMAHSILPNRHIAGQCATDCYFLYPISCTGCYNEIFINVLILSL